MPDIPPQDEQAVRYLLGELEGPEKDRFEAALAASPTLRASLQELESACEALALSAPPRRTPRDAWQRISRTLNSSPQPTEPTPVRTPFWLALCRDWFGRAGWAAAAIAVLWATRPHLSRTQPAHPSSTLAAAESQPTNPESTQAINTPTTHSPAPASGTPQKITPSPAQPQPTPPESPAAPLSQREWAALRQRLRELGTLNETLARQLALPPGAARFQVFRLAPTNHPAPDASSAEALRSMAFLEPQDATPDVSALQNLITQALARELAASTPPTLAAATDIPSAPSSALPESTPNAPGADPTTTANAVNAANSTFAVIDLAAAQSTANQAFLDPAAPDSLTFANNRFNPPSTGSPSNPEPTTTPGSASAIGVYSPETGLGSIAFVAPDPLPPGYAYQFWVVNHQSASTYSLGTTAYSGGRMLVNFNLDPALVFSPGFLVTVEPAGGSPVPTGPVVAAPPSNTSFAPAP